MEHQEPTNEEQTQQSMPVFEPEPRIIEIEVPNDSAIFYYEGAIKAGIENLVQGKHLMELSGCLDDANSVQDAIHGMSKLWEVIQEVRTDIIKELTDFQRQMREFMASGGGDVQAAFVSTVEPNEDDDDEESD